MVAADEHPRPGTTLEALAELPLVFPEVDGLPESLRPDRRPASPTVVRR